VSGLLNGPEGEADAEISAETKGLFLRSFFKQEKR